MLTRSIRAGLALDNITDISITVKYYNDGEKSFLNITVIVTQYEYVVPNKHDINDDQYRFSFGRLH